MGKIVFGRFNIWLDNFNKKVSFFRGWWVALIGHFVPCLVVSTLMRGIHVCDRYPVPFASLGLWAFVFRTGILGLTSPNEVVVLQLFIHNIITKGSSLLCPLIAFPG